MIARFFAVAVLVGALLCAGAEAAQWGHSGRYDSLSGIELWTALERHSLAFVQHGIERLVAPWVWDPIITWFLMKPAWLLMGTPALMVLWLHQPKLHPRFLRRRRFAPTRGHDRH